MPTKLDLKLPEGISLQKIEFSSPSVYESDIVGQALQMKGKSYFLILLKLSEKIDLGKKDLELLFFYQLCKKDLCFFPKTQKLEFVIQVSQNKGKKNHQFYELVEKFPQERALEEIVTKNSLANELVNLSMNKKNVDYFFFFDRPKGKRLISRKNISQQQFNKKDLVSWVSWGKNIYYTSISDNNLFLPKKLDEIGEEKAIKDNSLLFYLFIAFIGGFNS